MKINLTKLSEKELLSLIESAKKRIGQNKKQNKATIPHGVIQELAELVDEIGELIIEMKRVSIPLSINVDVSILMEDGHVDLDWDFYGDTFDHAIKRLSEQTIRKEIVKQWSESKNILASICFKNKLLNKRLAQVSKEYKVEEIDLIKPIIINKLTGTSIIPNISPFFIDDSIR